MLQTSLEFIRSQLLLYFSFKVDLRLIFSYFRHVLQLPVSFFETRKTGEILSRIGDAQKIRAALSEMSVSLVMDTVMIAAVGVVLFFQSSLLFWIALVMVFLSSTVVVCFAKPFARNYRKIMTESADVESHLVEIIGGSSTVKAMNAEDLAYQKYERLQMKTVWTGLKLGRTKNVQTFLENLIDGFGVNVVFWVGAYFIIQGDISLGQLIAFNSILTYFTGPLNRLLQLQSSLQEAFVAANRPTEVMDLDKEIPLQGRWLKPKQCAGEIIMSNVDFRYGTRELVLENLSLHIACGQKVAFVGTSGCGKITLVKLLLKFYQPEKGNIFLDGHNLQDIDTLYLRHRIGYVPQETILFSGTIAENVAIHRPDANMEDITRACEEAGAHEFIVNLPQRYNTTIMEKGSCLSGGERQRLALARALLGPQLDLLILDESTSHLDALSEQKMISYSR